MWTLRRTPTTHLLFTPVPHSHNAPRTTLGVAARAKTHTAKDRVANVLPTPTGLPTFCQRRAARMQPRFQMYPTAGGPVRDPPTPLVRATFGVCVRACVRYIFGSTAPQSPHTFYIASWSLERANRRRRVDVKSRRHRAGRARAWTGCGRVGAAPASAARANRAEERRVWSSVVWACTLRFARLRLGAGACVLRARKMPRNVYTNATRCKPTTTHSKLGRTPTYV